MPVQGGRSIPKFSAAKLLIVLTVLMVPFSKAHAQAANYPPTITVPVTYYDFHADGSNPEFEKTPTNGTGGTYLHMVADTCITVNGVRKPVLGSAPYWDCDISKWFVAWTPGDFTIPNYTNPATSD